VARYFVVNNRTLSELLALEGEKSKPPLSRAYKKAARSAILWPEEAAQLLAEKRSLTELSSVGPFIAKMLTRWIDSPPQGFTVPPIRASFLFLAEAKRLLSAKPAWRARLKGDLQMHTRWSDGTGTVAEMAEAGAERDYEYIALTDHGKALKIAGGIDESDLARQGQEIKAANETLAREGRKLRVLRSVELNLDVKGRGDIEPKALKNLDIVLGAFHSSLRKSDDQTSRYLGALSERHLNILGHPRGRIFNYRLGLSGNWKQICDKAASSDKALEIDCYPDRQDLDVETLKIARRAGVKISLGTDSHHPYQLDFIELGLAAALLAKIPAERILNFWTRDKLLAWASKTW
jgi:histidinol phosphatase-like PHP family hydrolase